MTKINLVAAVDENNGLGKDNHLLCHLPADLKYFKQLTLGKPILMGRKTFLSIGKALPGRRNIVLSRSMQALPDIEVARSISEALELVKEADELMVIGGAHIYREILPLADSIYLTRIHHQFDADVFFPTIDPKDWESELLAKHAIDAKNAFAMSFFVYRCCASNPLGFEII